MENSLISPALPSSFFFPFATARPFFNHLFCLHHSSFVWPVTFLIRNALLLMDCLISALTLVSKGSQVFVLCPPVSHCMNSGNSKMPVGHFCLYGGDLQGLSLVPGCSVCPHALLLTVTSARTVIFQNCCQLYSYMCLLLQVSRDVLTSSWLILKASSLSRWDSRADVGSDSTDRGCVQCASVQDGSPHSQLSSPAGPSAAEPCQIPSRRRVLCSWLCVLDLSMVLWLDKAVSGTWLFHPLCVCKGYLCSCSPFPTLLP